jgi:putative ABC transport system permease protein
MIMADGRNWKKKAHIDGHRPEVHNRPIDETVANELHTGIELLAEDLVREGWEPEEARREAQRRFGDPGRVGRWSRRILRRGDRRRSLLMFFDQLGLDIRFALRALRTAPGFALIAVLILALGIGANVAVFSLLKGLIIRPMPYPEPDRIVAVWQGGVDSDRGGSDYQPLTGPDYFDFREQNSTFQELGVYTFRWFNTAVGPEPERIRGVSATAGVLDILGLPPLYGRYFTEEEETAGSSRVVVLGHAYWQDYFQGDPTVVGRMITMERESWQVIGILPPDFEFPSPWGVAEPVRLITPIELSRTEGRGSHWLAALGRLADGVSVAQAQADLKAIAARLRELYPHTNALVGVWIDPLMRRALGGINTILVILLIIVGLVLLAGCANIASMMLARGAARQSEMAIRSSLGAGGGRIVRQLLTESALLSVLGGIAGIALAYWSLGVLKGLFPPTVPRIEGIGMDGWVLLYAFLAMLATGLLFGLAPALFAARTNLVEVLTGGGGGRTGGRRRNRALDVLVIAQIALALMLVNAALLLFLSFRNVAREPQGFDTDEVLAISLQISGPGYDTLEARNTFWGRLLERLRTAPGVTAVGVTTKLPTLGGTNGSVLTEGETYDPEERHPLVELSFATPGYFEAMGINIVRGRNFEAGELVTPTSEVLEGPVIVNQAFAQRYWPDADPIGQRIRANSEEPDWYATVVGVAEDCRQWGLLYPTLPERYHPITAVERTNNYLVLRSAGDPTALTQLVRSAVAELDPQLPLGDVRTMADIIGQRMQSRRLYTLLIGLFTLIAVVLATAGTYGVMSFRVNQRTHEIGVQMALGAARSQVMRHFLRQGLRLTLSGGIIGFFMLFFGVTIISSMIYGISPLQILTLLAGIVLLGTVVVAAMLVPALRATRVDPMEALRAE